MTGPVPQPYLPPWQIHPGQGSLASRLPLLSPCSLRLPSEALAYSVRQAVCGAVQAVQVSVFLFRQTNKSWSGYHGRAVSYPRQTKAVAWRLQTPGFGSGSPRTFALLPDSLRLGDTYSRACSEMCVEKCPLVTARL